ncbi:tRNA-intron lyase [Candidatus Bathyarchaeota archaeon]|nr:tRNA-intron lyase [Candidatus Bathyarchaeota archaeon]
MSGLNGERKEIEAKRNVIEALLRDSGVLIRSEEDSERLSQRGYGIHEDKGLLLTFYEAMYLCGKGLIRVIDEKTGKQVGFQELLEKYKAIEKNAWIKYLIYRDLRSRGYVVREGFGLGADFRLYERGEYSKDSADYLVYGIYEGMSLSIEGLAQILMQAQNLKKTLILAVINRRGEIVYYSLSRLNF